MPVDVQVAIHIVMWWASLMPLAVWAVTTDWRKQQPPSEYLLLSAALALSWAMGAGSWLSMELNQPGMWATYAGAPFQFAVFWVLVFPGSQRWYLLVAALMFGLQWTLPADPRVPAALFMGVAGLPIAYRAWRAQWLGEWRNIVMIYCGIAAPCLLVMGARQPQMEGSWFWAWTLYQIVRAMALTLMAVILVRRPKEVADAATGNNRGVASLAGSGYRQSRVSVRHRTAGHAVDRSVDLGAQTTARSNAS